jgi:hypothetical protein
MSDVSRLGRGARRLRTLLRRPPPGARPSLEHQGIRALNLTAVSDLLQAANMAMLGPRAVEEKQVNAMARLLGVVTERLESAKVEFDAIRPAA